MEGNIRAETSMKPDGKGMQLTEQRFEGDEDGRISGLKQTENSYAVLRTDVYLSIHHR